jgi:hypothetical protein
MGSGEGIGSSCWEYSGHIREDRQNLWEKQWAQAKTAESSAESAVGPPGVVGSTFQNNNGPRQSRRQHILQMQWAHSRICKTPFKKLMGPAKLAGAEAVNTMGPSGGIGSTSQRNNGPKRS